MTVLFGSIEYFEQEILNATAQRDVQALRDSQLMMIYSGLKNELLYDFVCEEMVRLQCLENLHRACSRLFETEMCVVSR